MANTSNIKIEPVNAFWGNQTTDKVLFVADVAGSLNSKYFDISGLTNAQVVTNYYVWFNINAAGADPTIAGKTGIEVAGATGASAATLAAAAQALIDAKADLNCVVDPDSTATLVIEAKGMGASTAAADGAAPTAFTFTAQKVGSRLDLGLLDGDVEFAFTEDMKDISAHQEGTSILQRIRTGTNIEAVSFSLKEATATKLVAILEAGGVSVTPSGGTSVTGWGNSKLFSNITASSKKLQLHPARITSATDLSEDWGFWLGYPSLESFNFSGETEQLIGVSFSFLPDCLKLATVDRFVYGDHSQNLLKV